MRSLICAAWAGVVVLCAVAPAHAQRSTEQFIPIGMSPGVSNKATSIGLVDTLIMQQRMVAVRDQAVRRTVKITDKTWIWLDRSKLKLPNLRGRLADVQRGRRVEVKYADPETRLVAEWVKVEITEP
jgi:hypothetical protein